MRKVKVGDFEVTLKELSVGEIRDFMRRGIDEPEDAKPEDIDILSGVLFEDISLEELAWMARVNVEAFNDLMPSEIENLVKECRKVNPHFFDMKVRVRRLHEKISRLSMQSAVP